MRRNEMPATYPPGWAEQRLEDVAEIRTGLAKSTQRTSAGDIELPYLRVANVQDGRLDLSEVKTIRVRSDSADRYTLRDGDVLFTEGGDFDKLGRGAVWHGEIAPCLHQNHVFAVRSDRAKLLPSFLAYFAAGPVGKAFFLASAKRTTNLASINSSQLRAFPIPVPPLPEQRKIAVVLSSVDGAIEASQAVIDQLQVVKRAMMAEMLTKGLPGRHKRFKQTEIGAVPEAWQVSTFGNICSKIVDGVHSKPEYVPRGIPFVTVKNMTAVDEGISFEDLNYITEEDHAGFINRAHPERGDVLLTKDGTLGVPRVVETDVVFSIFVSVALMKPIHSLVDSWFMRFALESPKVAAHFNVVHAGLALKHIHLIDLRATPCPLPPLAEQREIAASLRAIGSQVVAAREHVVSLRQVKSALMSVLLTGEVRVPTEEGAVCG